MTRIYTPDELAAAMADDDGTFPHPHPQCWCGDCAARCAGCNQQVGHLDGDGAQFYPDFHEWLCDACLDEWHRSCDDEAALLRDLRAVR